MKLTDKQLADWDRDGFLILPDLYSDDEMNVMWEEAMRIASLETDLLLAQGSIRTFYRMHELDGDTASELYHNIARMPRTLEPMQQLLETDEVYIYNSRIDSKDGVFGTPRLWHQDYGYWRLDRVPKPQMATYMYALVDHNELNGCLWIVPGSHKSNIRHHGDTDSTQFKQWTPDMEQMRETMRALPEPVPLNLKRGSAAIFHCAVLHSSGVNLSPEDRWVGYYVYNAVSNSPVPSAKIRRPEHMVSQNHAPLQPGDDGCILRFGETKLAAAG